MVVLGWCLVCHWQRVSGRWGIRRTVEQVLRRFMNISFLDGGLFSVDDLSSLPSVYCCAIRIGERFKVSQEAHNDRALPSFLNSQRLSSNFSRYSRNATA